MKRRRIHPAVTHRGRTRPGFTLSELVVAVAILALMMLLAGQVFTITVKSTGQATALATVNQRVRALEQSLREDLRYVSPRNSILVAVGRPVKAYWTPQGRDADNAGTGGKDPLDGYPHLPDPEREDAAGNLVPPRADMLAFFTSRWGTSATYPGASSNSQFVVYGHVNACEYKPDASKKRGYKQEQWNPDKDAFPSATDDDATATEVPARDWHMSRRALLLMPSAAPPRDDKNYRDPIDNDYSIRWRKYDEGQGLRLVDPIDAMENEPDDPDHYAVLNGYADVLYNFDYDGVVLRDAIPWPLTDPDSGLDGPQYDGPRQTWDHLFDWLVKPSQGRSTLDGTLPAALAEQGGLAGYLLSHCCSFKVEWTFDDRSLMAPYGYPDGVLGTGDHVVWFDTQMEKDVNLLKTLEDEEKYYDEKKDRQRRQAFMEMHDVLVSTDTQMAPCRFDPVGVYGPDAPSAMGMYWFPRTVSGTCSTPDWDDPALTVGPDPFFPTALRITVDVMDDLGRLDRPVRHVMVIPVGQ
ncbi:MAG: prepilin-type N-terminal cleavage/methylation domain-containing protein [Phycisphaerales bacterium]|nr:prepilin-type N-terminal cleavage/methylation domain-containing protein [Phycisphaerales bacterium]